LLVDVVTALALLRKGFLSTVCGLTSLRSMWPPSPTKPGVPLSTNRQGPVYRATICPAQMAGSTIAAAPWPGRRLAI
jgi:hypothetical protein